MSAKAQFMQKEKYKNLSKKEKERRWKQRQASLRSARTGQTPGTTMKVRQRKGRSVAELVLSPCAQEYFAAMTVPFSLKQAACVPDLHSLPSKKIRVKTRGVFSTGVTGAGFCLGAPWANCSDGGAILLTGSTWNPDPINPTIPVGAQVGTTGETQPKLPYVSTVFKGEGNNDPGVSARTVATALRIRYTGTEYARSGTILGLREPDNITLRGRTYGQIRTYSTAKAFSNSRKWHYAMWRPASPSDYEYSNYPIENQENNLSLPSSMSFGFFITGTTDASGNLGPAPFEYEMIRYVEYIGNIDNITHSHVDVEGVSQVRNSLPTKSVTDNPHSHFHKAIQQIETAAEQTLPALAGGAMIAKSASSEGGILGTIEEGLSSIGSRFASFLPDLGEAGALFEEAAPLMLAM